MEPYFTPSRLWPDGPYLQVCVLPDLDRDKALNTLIDGAQDVLDDFAGIALVPREWLHVTVQACLHQPAAAIPAEDRTRLAHNLAAVLSELPAFTVHAGSLLAGSAGVVLDMSPDGEIDVLYDRVREVMREALGPQAAAKNSRPAHMAVGYCRSSEDSGIIGTRLRRDVRPSHAPMTVDAVHLVEVTPDPERCQFSWTPVLRIPLLRPGQHA